MPTNSPRVSVITCVYNGKQFLAQAIESVLNQTWRDFEYIIVNNASTDSSAEIIASYALRDPRIVAHHNPTNPNTSYGLNLGLYLAQGEYVAILDQDDLAYPERLALQVAFLDAHPEVGVLGTQVHKIDQAGKQIGASSFPTDLGVARWEIFYQTPILHSAAMMRRSLVIQVGGYSLPHWRMTDYELFTRLIKITQVTNLPESLVAYRTHPWQISSIHRKPQHAQVALLIHALLVERLDVHIGLSDINLFYNAMRAQKMPDEAALLRTGDLLGMIYARFMQIESLDEASRDLVRQDCAWRWLGMAWTHRQTFRAASRQIHHRALELDPQIWQRPQTWRRVRRLHRQAGRANQPIESGKQFLPVLTV